MISEQVERVARAILAATQPGSDPDVLVGHDPLRFEPKWAQFIPAARAAIEAIGALPVEEEGSAE